MTRFSHLVIAAFFAAIVGVVSLAPARAASVPVGAATGIEQTSKALTETVQYRRGYYRRRYVRPYRAYRPYPVYRRCYVRPRTVWTPYGYVRRMVRVCR
jgi:hypothetical protein